MEEEREERVGSCFVGETRWEERGREVSDKARGENDERRRRPSDSACEECRALPRKAVFPQIRPSVPRVLKASKRFSPWRIRRAQSPIKSEERLQKGVIWRRAIAATSLLELDHLAPRSPSRLKLSTAYLCAPRGSLSKGFSCRSLRERERETARREGGA